MACKAKNYGALGSHPPEVITQDENHRFVTDAQIAQWNEAATHAAQFMAMMFRRSATVPATPEGGSFQFPIPDGGLWTNTILPGIDPVFVSTRLFTFTGESPQQLGWSPPVLFVQNGAIGSTGSTGATGQPGIPGTPGVGVDGAKGVDGNNGVSINWLGEINSEIHPLNAVDGDAYYNSFFKKSFIYWDPIWYQMTVDGTDGQGGLHSSIVTLYYKNTSDTVEPAATFTGPFTYDFTTGILTGGILNGWSQTMPSAAAGEYIWARQASAVSETTMDFVIEDTEFAGAVVITGVGIDGINSATIALYQKNTSNTVAPAAPTGTFTYTFAKPPTFTIHATLGGNFNGWTLSQPEVATGEKLWEIHATASSRDATDTILATEFSVPVISSSGGIDGLSIVWHGDAATPDLAWQLLNHTYRDTSNGWVYIWNGIAWELMVLDGSDGTDAPYTSFIYINAASTPTTPTGGTYDGTTETYPAGWSDDPTTPPVGQYTYESICRYTWDGSVWVGSVWSTPSKHSGAPGMDGVSVYITYNDSVAQPATPTNVAGTLPSGWHTNATTAVRWMSQKVDDGTTAAWGTPIPTRGEDGLDGTGTDGPRGSNTFTIDESTPGTTYITPTVAVSWAGALTNSNALAVARDVLYFASDGYIRTNDKITVTDTSAQIAGTRIYTGLPRNSATISAVLASDFSTLVTDVINGSMIVTGTLSADRLAADVISGGKIIGTLLEITTASIVDAAITTAKIGSLAVTNALIADAAITNAKIGSLAVDTLKIANNAVTMMNSASLASNYAVSSATFVSIPGFYWSLNLPAGLGGMAVFCSFFMLSTPGISSLSDGQYWESGVSFRFMRTGPTGTDYSPEFFPTVTNGSIVQQMSSFSGIDNYTTAGLHYGYVQVRRTGHTSAPDPIVNFNSNFMGLGRLK